eukprot:TRINITY_DN3571_c0_g1_i2.p1 TRINITY_DN3571_c0_g1~~TRINITY_DN3571_c0_g1_i2.p1  ORF type:complete len:406 (-),score=69.54 TRINITY_DN3571_c0_g1_i2:43-1260(-)
MQEIELTMQDRPTSKPGKQDHEAKQEAEEEKKENEKKEVKKTDEDEEETDAYTAFANTVVEILNEADPDPPETEDHHTCLVKIFINQLDALETSSEKVFVDFGIQYWYKDSTLVGKEGEDFDKTLIFVPTVEIVNAVDIEPILYPDDNGTYYILPQFSPHGIVNNFQRYRGIMRAPFQLREFPFDTQILRLTVRSMTWAEDCLTFRNSTDHKAIVAMAGCCNSLKEWDLLGNPEIIEESFINPEDERGYSQITVELQYKRKTGFYIQNVVVLVLMILLMGLSVFFIPSDSLNDRTAISITLFLAAVAFNFVVVGVVPRISHHTYLSSYFFATYGIIVAEVVANVVSFLLWKYYGEHTAQVFDWATLIAFALLSFVCSMIFVIIGIRKGTKKDSKTKNVEEKKKFT